MKNEGANKVSSTILGMIPVAMAVAVVALSVLGQITADTAAVMLSVGMFSGGIERLREKQ